MASEVLAWLRASVIVRLIVMVCVMLALLIPMLMIRSVVAERAERRDTVVRDVSLTWGGPQVIGGPVLAVPYRHIVTGTDGKPREVMAHATFLPDRLQVKGDLQPEVRQRGLFKAVVYRARLAVSGRFVRPAMSEVRPLPAEPIWEDATLTIGVSDPRGISNRLTVAWNGPQLPVTPGGSDDGLFAGALRVAIPDLRAIEPGTPLPFAFDLALNGSRDLRLLPTGSDTVVELTSPWPHPSFVGAPLPETRSTGAAGFSATWRVPYFGRGYPASWSSASVDRGELKGLVDASAFGVSLIQPGDIYQQTERAVKYAVLFIVLTFATFFLWEMLLGTLLHPIQYLFIGFALCVFYLLLISLSEHVGFDRAYATAAAATTILIGAYAGSALAGWRGGLAIGAVIGALYGGLYMLLRLEDHALLVGSIALFVMLAAVMFLTRRVNWFDLRIDSSATTSS